MSRHAEIAKKQLDQAGKLDKELKAKLKLEPPYATQVIAVRRELRKAYEDVLFLDFRYAQERDVETALWMKAHHRSIEAFRSHISKLSATAEGKKPVELRKLVGHFIDFLKESSKYYRALVARLISHFGVTELHHVLRMLDMEIPKQQVKCSADMRESITKSCHTIFVYLGDLSRYRELQSVSKNGEKNWGPALGYYQFARRLLPTAGTPMNQLAVVTIQTGDTFASSYYFLRASCAAEPFATAQENLALGFKKVLKRPAAPDAPVADRFMRLLAQSFGEAGMETADPLVQLQHAINERSIACDTLTRLVCSIIAVHHLKPEPANLQLLLDTLKVLLDVLCEQMNVMADTGGELATRVSAVVRRMLPALRLLSRWLSLNLKLGRPLWNKYIHAMTLCGSKFPRHLLPAIQPLAEDIDMRGFSPLDGGLRASAMTDVEVTENEVPLRLSAFLSDAADNAAAIHFELAKNTKRTARDPNLVAMHQMVDELVT